MKSLAFFLILFFCLFSCYERPISIPEQVMSISDRWIISGRIGDPAMKNSHLQAISLNGAKYRSQTDENNNFAIELPGQNTYVIYFIDERADSSNRPPALTFEDGTSFGLSKTLRLPFCYNHSVLDLGQVDINGEDAYPSHNPSSSLDFDQDGLNDYSDRDDQNDRLNDALEKDALERITICHFDQDHKKGLALPIQLFQVYEHLQHGDHVGSCPIH